MSTDLALTEVAGHLAGTRDMVTAWYAVPEARWAFRGDLEREALISAVAGQYAALAGFRLHLRRTSRPFPAAAWGRALDEHTPRPLPDVPGASSWAEHVVAAQRHLLVADYRYGQTYLGVEMPRRTLADQVTTMAVGLLGRRGRDAGQRRLARAVQLCDEVLAGPGLGARRARPEELDWLLYRSTGLCMLPPDELPAGSEVGWEQGDIAALTEDIEYGRDRYGATTMLVSRLTGQRCHVAVLSVGRMEALYIPDRDEPWLHLPERLGWPVELSSRVEVLGPGSAFRSMDHRLRMIRSQQADYTAHQLDAPPELERLADRARAIGDEMTTALPVTACRVHGWHRLAIGAPSRDECLERVRDLQRLYASQLRITLRHPRGQLRLVREFIPGEPVVDTGYLRRMPVRMFAAAMPQAASRVGDQRGDLVGRTAGTSQRPVFFDPHLSMEVRERSGLAILVAEPGGGKSTLMGALGYLAARRGVRVTLLDPSGPLVRLCQMPELRAHARVLALTGSRRGTLAPYALIPTPSREQATTENAGDRDFDTMVAGARAERRMLVQDICAMLLPPQIVRQASTATLLRHAVRQVPAEEFSMLDDVVTALSDHSEDGKELAELLLDAAEMPLAQLFFGRPEEGVLADDTPLTVITMAGLRLPDLSIEREYWSAEEALALPMLHTAHRLAVRRCYSADMHTRKLVGLDEAHFVHGWASGRSFLIRLARDCRKWNLAALVASQNPQDILDLDVPNLVSTVFVGRVADDPQIATQALRLLRLPTGTGYEHVLADLSPADPGTEQRLGYREFVVRDVDGNVEKVRIDMSHVPGLLDHLDTTPTAP
jgi:hypothetical protein